MNYIIRRNIPISLSKTHTCPKPYRTAGSDVVIGCYQILLFLGRYGDNIREMAWSVGAILDEVRRLGEDFNTLSIFTSDNGPDLHLCNEGGDAGSLKGTSISFDLPLLTIVYSGENEGIDEIAAGPLLYMSFPHPSPHPIPKKQMKEIIILLK